MWLLYFDAVQHFNIRRHTINWNRPINVTMLRRKSVCYTQTQRKMKIVNKIIITINIIFFFLLTYKIFTTIMSNCIVCMHVCGQTHSFATVKLSWNLVFVCNGRNEKCTGPTLTVKMCQSDDAIFTEDILSVVSIRISTKQLVKNENG